MKKHRSLKKLIVKKTTLRSLSDKQLNEVDGGYKASGSCGGGRWSCCHTESGDESCAMGGGIEF